MSAKEDEELQGLVNSLNWGEAIKYLEQHSDKLSAEAVASTLETAAWSGKKEVVETLCNLKGDNCPAKKTVEYVFQMAAWNGYKEVVEILCKMKGDNCPDKEAVRLGLQWAAQNGHKEVVEILCKMKGNNCPDENAVLSALKAAILNGHKELVEILCKMEGDNCPGQWAVKFVLEAAVKNSHNEVVDILRKMKGDGFTTKVEVDPKKNKKDNFTTKEDNKKEEGQEKPTKTESGFKTNEGKGKEEGQKKLTKTESSFTTNEDNKKEEKGDGLTTKVEGDSKEKDYKDLIDKKLLPMSTNYLKHLEAELTKRGGSDPTGTLLKEKIAIIGGLVAILNKPEKLMSSSERVKAFYKQLNEGEIALKSHRDLAWKRYVRTAVIALVIVASFVFPGLFALAVYVNTGESKERKSFSFWKSQGTNLVEKLQGEAPDGVKDGEKNSLKK